MTIYFYHNKLHFMRRFLDDIFFIFCGPVANLHKFIEELNSFHPTIKFTMSHTFISNKNSTSDELCECKPLQAIPFLDMLCYIENGKILSELLIMNVPYQTQRYIVNALCIYPSVDGVKYIPHLRVSLIRRFLKFYKKTGGLS